MNYATKLDENTRLLIEAEASGAFVKSDLEELPDPETAVLRMVDTVAKVGAAMAKQITPGFQGTGCSWELSFSVKADGFGTVMIANTPEAGQFKVSVIYAG